MLELPPPKDDLLHNCKFPDFDAFRGSVLSYGVDFHGKHKVLDYSFERMTVFAGIPSAFSMASIFRLSKMLPMFIMLQVLVAVAVSCCYQWSDTSVEELRRDAESIEDVTMYLNYLVSFNLGLFINVNL